jgi:hypothetical protein
MLKNRKIQLFGIAILIAAAILVTISAVGTPASAFVPVTGSNLEGLAQYQRSERSAQVENQKGLATYHQSERMQAPIKSNAEGLAIYHLSERGMPLDATNGMAIYHQSERTQPVNWTKSIDPLYKYHQSEWFGK